MYGTMSDIDVRREISDGLLLTGKHRIKRKGEKPASGMWGGAQRWMPITAVNRFSVFLVLPLNRKWRRLRVVRQGRAAGLFVACFVVLARNLDLGSSRGVAGW